MKGFDYNMNKKDWIKRRSKNVDEISKGRKNITVRLALGRKEDEDILHDPYFVQKESEKKENKLEERNK